jgi:hypothetical protein
MSCQLDTDEGPPVGRWRPGGFVASCQTEQVRAALADAERANVSQVGEMWRGEDDCPTCTAMLATASRVHTGRGTQRRQ